MRDEENQHALVSKLKDVAIELGRTPTRDEFVKANRGGKEKIDLFFGGYAAFVHAAGLEPVSRKRTLTNDIFNCDIDRHLELYRAQELVPSAVPLKSGQYPHAAIISDVHFPFHSQRVLERFYRYVSDEKPDFVMADGDMWDLYSQAKFPRSHNVFTPKDEEAQARKLNEEFWAIIKAASPKSRCIQMLGNHDVRPLKRTIESMPTLEHWIQEVFKRLFTFDGVETVFDPRQEFELPGGIMVHHGYRTKLGDHMNYMLHSAVVGHTHRPGVVWRKIRGQQLFELNCGLAGDPNAKGLSYTSQRIVDWVNAFGVIDPDGPRNIVC